MNLAESLLKHGQPDDVCFLYQDQKITYHAFRHYVAQWVTFLRPQINSSSKVLLMMDETPTLAGLFFGVLALGATPIVANPRLKPHEIDYMIHDSAVDIVFCDFDTPIKHINIHNIVLPQATAVHYVSVNPCDVAVIQYTSGSTGKPKGVHHSSEAILQCCQVVSDHLALTKNDIVYSVSKTFFGFGMGNTFFFPLFNGACAVLDHNWPTIALIKENLQKYQPTVLFAVPSVFNQLLQLDQVSLRIAQSSGSHLPFEIAKQWLDKFGIELLNAIGSTELLHIFAGTTASGNPYGSVGRVIGQNKIKIVDDGGLTVACGHVGKLLISSPVLALGYTDNQHFNAFKEEWFTTGDLCHQDENGFLYFHGRVDDRFKINGRWVIPLEIENKIRENHPTIEQCYVTCVQDAHDFERVVLVVIGDKTQLQTLQGVNQHLPRYQNIDEVLIIDQTPLNSNGKIDRKQIKTIASDYIKSKNLEVEVASYGVDEETYHRYIQQGYNLVPIWKQLHSKQPISATHLYRNIVEQGGFIFEKYDHQQNSCKARYSIIGLDTKERIQIKENTLSYFKDDAILWQKHSDEPLKALQKLQQQYRVPKFCDVPEFFGGYIGYFGFETTRLIEPRLAKNDLKQTDLYIPDVVQILAKQFLVIDHQKQAVYCVAYACPETYQEAKQACDTLSDQVMACFVQSEDKFVPKATTQHHQISCGINRPEFLKKVQQVKEYINAGDVMQVVLSHRMQAPLECDALTYYEALKSVCYTPYTYCIDLNDFQVVGASPEELVKYYDHHVSSRPMAGTRRRTGQPDQDSVLSTELLNDPKEQAEHMMLVDLARNDLGRIALPGCVCVEDLMQVELYSHVMHLVSTVTAPTNQNITGLDALIATFPAGTLSGASKVRALEIIQELEPQPRGVYGGVVGYIDWHGNADLAIAIRTSVLKDNTMYVQAGAGIVSDSIAENEWQETMDKSRLLFVAASQLGCSYSF
ncbi:chorismate-binding protein [Acinetobacter sp. HY1485]|uniref:chorismate-binding protein n=1 Tax=Acinetobacter sp. HY1485 TaxID=2970918 RepID=UPI0022B95F14|nr:chorismate-binding protein [Acinetobacter sp. HY1485]